jgi:putative phosphoribosyl transferase
MQTVRDTPRGKPVRIDLAEGRLVGELTLPRNPKALVIVAHGSGVSHHNHPRSAAVARSLEANELATLQIELLTEEEAHIDRITTQLRFEMDMLAQRVDAILEWVANDRRVSELKVAILTTGTAAGAVMRSLAEKSDRAFAVVVRGGRPDLALGALRDVNTPTMLIVGSRDLQTLELNRGALEKLGGAKRLEIVQGAGPTFEEEGAVERVALLTNAWLKRYINGRGKPD